MTDFLIYEGKVAVAIAAFYMFYRLLLSKDTMHFFNRIVLLSTAVLSFILPFCVITVHRTVERAASDSAVGELMVSGMSEVPAGSDYWAIALLAVYVGGVVAVLVRMGVSMASAMEMIRKGCLVREEDGIRIIVSDKKIAPFSYMKYIVMSGEDWHGRNEDIIVHETAHIRRRHSVDVMLVELITAFQWFNPAVWMLRADLRALHEYEADDAVLRSGADVKEYQYLLIRKAVGASGYSITNSFNHSTLKNRITMMSCKKSSLWGAWKALYIVPLVGLSLAASARTVVDFRQPEGFASVPDSLGLKGKVVNEVVGVQCDVKQEKEEKSKPAGMVEEKPTFNGEGADAFQRYVMANLTYPTDADGKKAGTVHVSFTVGADGNVKDVKIVRGVSPAIDAEVVRVVSNSPKWKPGKTGGKPVDVSFMFPVLFVSDK